MLAVVVRTVQVCSAMHRMGSMIFHAGLHVVTGVWIWGSRCDRRIHVTRAQGQTQSICTR
jgi:hypothetical protein